MIHPIKTIKLNLRIISVLSSCNRAPFEELVDEFIGQPKIFRSKWYIWNIVRGKDFYKMLSHYVVEKTTNPEKKNHASAEWIIHMVAETTKDQVVLDHFIWAILKQVPLLTTVTIQCASAEKIRSILNSDKIIYTDDALAPFVKEIAILHARIKDLEDEVEAFKLMSEQ